jgi:elongation factor P hydroxylase
MMTVITNPGATPASDDRFQVEDLQAIFDGLFFKSCRTRLLRGGDEPLYVPADASVDYHRVMFAHGYFSSALHEVAHWCIAGERRRLQIDYGYWYVDDGRSPYQQQAFEQVEVKPQALEWLFTQACARRFHPSADNLSAETINDSRFRRALLAQVRRYCQGELPQRAEVFRTALCHFYGVTTALSASDFGAHDEQTDRGRQQALGV